MLSPAYLRKHNLFYFVFFFILLLTNILLHLLLMKMFIRRGRKYTQWVHLVTTILYNNTAMYSMQVNAYVYIPVHRQLNMGSAVATYLKTSKGVKSVHYFWCRNFTHFEKKNILEHEIRLGVLSFYLREGIFKSYYSFSNWE